MTTYLSIDVLELEPDWKEGLSEEYLRSIARLDPGTGRVQVDDMGGGPILTQPYRWFIDGRTELDTFRQFRDARRGRAVPFWMPTWKQDLVLASSAITTDTNLIIRSVGYTKFMFTNKARCHLALMKADGTKIYRKVTGANDNGNGTETLTLDSAVGTALDAATTMVCFLLLCRLGADEVVTHYHSGTAAEAEFPVTEIPREVP